ncbi:2-hydroxyacid dehydrogenase [Pseudoalteromonas pernae]|uniref:2-hydroxyacid dehydrogenase n=1 Tax=Pseudoalteromonas pernae TaxID=3118054 RepID=UPI0032424075
MSLLVAIPNRNIDKLVAKLHEQLGSEHVQIWPDISRPEDVTMVLGWQVPAELWQQLPNVQAVSSFGAGVDGLNLNAIPAHLPVARIVDNGLATDMAEYVLGHVLFHKLNMPRYVSQQQHQQWRPKRVKPYNQVGMLGFGQLGQAIAKRLVANDFAVCAWSNSAKNNTDGIVHYYGEDALEAMLKQCDYLVNVLPLTEQTHKIIDKELLKHLPNHCVLINVGRGQHVDEDALVEALNSGELAGASLDVFIEEPLRQSHPFWSTQNVIVTPHCSALSQIDAVVAQVVENYQRLCAGKTLLHRIDREKQY